MEKLQQQKRHERDINIQMDAMQSQLVWLFVSNIPAGNANFTENHKIRNTNTLNTEKSNMHLTDTDTK